MSIFGSLADTFVDAFASVLRDLVIAALGPLLNLLDGTLLTTPRPETLPAVGVLWSTSWQLTIAAYALLITIGAVLLMASGSISIGLTLRDLGERIPLAFLASAFSGLIAQRAVEVANALPNAILNHGIEPGTAVASLRDLVITSVTDSPTLLLLLLGLALSVLTAVLLCTYIARVVLTIVLIGAAPLLLAGHVLPQTDGIASWWWRAFSACLGVQVAQSFVLYAAMTVFFVPGGFIVLGSAPNDVVNLLTSITLMVILLRIPFWLARSVQIGRGGRSLLGQAARLYVVGRVSGVLPGGRGSRRRYARGRRP